MESSKSTFAVLILIFAVIAIGESALDAYGRKKKQCEKISIPMCQGIGYNMTSMPNKFNHQSQAEAGLDVHQFFPLVQLKCSNYLQFFLCSLYVPICMDNYYESLPPCRHVCEDARDGCFPLMKQFGFTWPEMLNCDNLPEVDDNQSGKLCMGPPKEQIKPSVTRKPSVTQPTTSPDLPPKKFNVPDDEEVDETATGIVPPETKWTGGASAIDTSVFPDACECRCLRPFVVMTNDGADSRTVGNVSRCAYPCYSPYLADNSNHRAFLDRWIGGWSISCSVITLITVLTFLIDRQRFRYPERPIFFLAFCCFGMSIGYIIRLSAGHESVACDANIVHGGATQANRCTVVFLFIYYFGMASAVWWVILAFTWFLAAGLKWSNEAITSYAKYFHAFAWILPAIKASLVMALNGVDGDPLSGVCYVGNTNTNMLRAFVIGPLIVYLLFGCFFLVSGFVSLVRIRHDMKAQYGQYRVDKLERLIVKLGLFAVLYSIPAICVICCLFYEQHFRQLWELAATCPCSPRLNPSETVFILALIKYAMQLVVGVTTGLWIWSGKTIASWKSLICCQTFGRNSAMSAVSSRSPRSATCNSRNGHGPLLRDCQYPVADAMLIKSHTDVSSGGMTVPNNNNNGLYQAPMTPNRHLYHGTMHHGNHL